MSYTESRALSILIALAIFFVLGSLWIEFRERRQAKAEYTGRERRRTRKVPELEPLGEALLKETQEMLNHERLRTREGLKFIMKMMSELYISDMRRTLKVNELVEQFEILRHKNLISWIEDHKKLSLALMLLFFSFMADEIRVPLVRFALSYIGVSFP
jgi:hypothetical protein